MVNTTIVLLGFTSMSMKLFENRMGRVHTMA